MNMQIAGDLPKGIQKITRLPDSELPNLWDLVKIDEPL